MILALACISVAIVSAPVAAQEASLPAGLTWGYVDSVDGLALTLDSGVTANMTDATKIVRMDGSDGAPEDITRGVKAELTVGAEGSITRVELLPAPLAPEYYLTNLTVRGATTVSATVGGRTYLRSLSALKASFTGVANAVALVGGVGFTPQGAKPAAARFSIVNAANDVLFQRTVKAGESSDFRLNFPAGQAQTLTLLAASVGEGTPEPEWCLWLDPKLAGPLPTTQGAGIHRTTAGALLADLKQALGETNPGPMAVALFTAQRVRDDQIIKDLQEDLVVGAVRAFQVAGKSAQRPELGMPLPDAAKKEAEQLGAKCMLVGSVSDREQIVVVNAALIDAASGAILATARAWQ